MKINKQRSLFGHSLTYLLGYVLSRVIGLVSVPVYTHFLTTEQYGQLSAFYSIVAISVVVFTLNGYKAVNRRYFEPREDFAAFVGTSLVVSLGATLFFSTFYLVTIETIERVVNVPRPLLLLVLALVPVQVLRSVYLQICTAEKRSTTVSSINTLALWGGFGAAVTYLLTTNLERAFAVALGALTIEGSLAVFVTGPGLRRRAAIRVSKERVRYAVVFGVPLIPYALSGILLATFDRLMIMGLLGAAQGGLYSFAYNIGMLANMFIMAVATAWQPYYYDLRNRDDSEIARGGNRGIFSLMVLACVGVASFGGNLGFVLGDSAFHPALPLIPIVAMSYVFYGVYRVYFSEIVYRKKTAVVSSLTIGAAILNVGLNAYGIPRFGYAFAAWSTLISYAVLAVVTAAYVTFQLQADTFLIRDWTRTMGLALVFVPNLIVGIVLSPSDVTGLAVTVPVYLVSGGFYLWLNKDVPFFRQLVSKLKT